MAVYQKDLDEEDLKWVENCKKTNTDNLLFKFAILFFHSPYFMAGVLLFFGVISILCFRLGTSFIMTFIPLFCLTLYFYSIIKKLALRVKELEAELKKKG